MKCSLDTKLGQPSFNARINKELIKNAQNFCLKRGLDIQYSKINRRVESCEYWGDDNSEIFHAMLKNNHLLLLKNTKINKKQASILYSANKYWQIINHLSNLSQFEVERAEKALIKE